MHVINWSSVSMTTSKSFSSLLIWSIPMCVSIQCYDFPEVEVIAPYVQTMQCSQEVQMGKKRQTNVLGLQGCTWPQDLWKNILWPEETKVEMFNYTHSAGKNQTKHNIFT